MNYTEPNTNPKTNTVTFRVTPDLLRDLAELATWHERTISDYLRVAIRRDVAGMKAEKEKRARNAKKPT